MGREAKIMNKLTKKQNAFVGALVSGKSATQAVMVAYNVNDSKTASVIASQNLSKLSIREALDEALRTNGLTVDVITGNIGGLANTKPDKVSGDTVLKANIELLKLRGAYLDKKSFQVSYSVKQQLSSMNYRELKSEVERLDNELNEIMSDNPGYTQTDL